MTNSDILPALIFGVPSVVLLILLAISRIINNKWFCKTFGWHKAPKQKNLEGISLKGTCPVCAKDVMQDSEGNWF